jgi:hypothetical protein
VEDNPLTFVIKRGSSSILLRGRHFIFMFVVTVDY